MAETDKFGNVDIYREGWGAGVYRQHLLAQSWDRDVANNKLNQLMLLAKT